MVSCIHFKNVYLYVYVLVICLVRLWWQNSEEHFEWWSDFITCRILWWWRMTPDAVPSTSLRARMSSPNGSVHFLNCLCESTIGSCYSQPQNRNVRWGKGRWLSGGTRCSVSASCWPIDIHVRTAMRLCDLLVIAGKEINSFHPHVSPSSCMFIWGIIVHH